MKEGLIKPLIAVDLDNVLCDLITSLNQYHNKTYHTDFMVRDYRSFDLWKTWGGSQTKAIQKVMHFYSTEYCKLARPVKGARKYVELLRQNNTLAIITARHEEYADITYEWIDKYFKHKFDSVYFTNNYSLSPDNNPLKKSQVCQSIGANVLLEDNLHNALDCAQSGVRVLLFSKIHNQHKPLPRIIRVKSWKEAYQKLNNH